jgi:hypothetical protein
MLILGGGFGTGGGGGGGAPAFEIDDLGSFVGTIAATDQVALTEDGENVKALLSKFLADLTILTGTSAPIAAQTYADVNPTTPGAGLIDLPFIRSCLGFDSITSAPGTVTYTWTPSASAPVLFVTVDDDDDMDITVDDANLPADQIVFLYVFATRTNANGGAFDVVSGVTLAADYNFPTLGAATGDLVSVPMVWIGPLATILAGAGTAGVEIEA